MNNLASIFRYGATSSQVVWKKVMQPYPQAIEQDSEPSNMYHPGCLLQHADNTVIWKDAMTAKELYEQVITKHNDVDAMSN